MWGSVTRSDDVRKANRRRILSLIRRRGLISRTDICQETGLSAATVSAITSDLIAEQLLVGGQPRDETISVGRGRPRVDLCIKSAAGVVGAVNLQINSVTAAIADYAGSPVADSRVHIDTLAASSETIRYALVRCLSNALTRAGKVKADLRGIAVSIQGITDMGATTLLWSPATKQRNLPIEAWLRDAFGVRASVCNESDLMARALNWEDPARYSGIFAAILMAHGVGMGLFLRGRTITGTKTSGTEFGHMIHVPGGALCRCGSRGCIEAYAADYAIKRRADGLPETAPPPSDVSADEMARIVDAARLGDENAIAAIVTAGRAIGTGLASIYALIDPFPVALIGRGTITREFLEPAIHAAIEASAVFRIACGDPGAKADPIRIDFFSDDDPLIEKGCVIRALLALDDELAAA